ncbi:hypothetical protein H9P43_006367 [Blastocladiella emersonii ATCC 22665]|nr:hypothetical protein H9P43_006367 [Blastocladiella emersonii ATCC 22665]
MSTANMLEAQQPQPRDAAPGKKRWCGTIPPLSPLTVLGLVLIAAGFSAWFWQPAPQSVEDKNRATFTLATILWDDSYARGTEYHGSTAVLTGSDVPGGNSTLPRVTAPGPEETTIARQLVEARTTGLPGTMYRYELTLPNAGALGARAAVGLRTPSRSLAHALLEADYPRNSTVEYASNDLKGCIGDDACSKACTDAVGSWSNGRCRVTYYLSTVCLVLSEVANVTFPSPVGCYVESRAKSTTLNGTVLGKPNVSAYTPSKTPPTLRVQVRTDADPVVLASRLTGGTYALVGGSKIWMAGHYVGVVCWAVGVLVLAVSAVRYYKARGTAQHHAV